MNLLEGSLGYQPAFEDQSAYVKGFARMEFENLFGRGRRFSLRYNKKDPLSHEMAVGVYQPFVFYQPLSVSFAVEQLKYDSLYQKLSVKSRFEYGEGGNILVRVSGGWSRYTPQGSTFRGVFHSRQWWWGIGTTIDVTSSGIAQSVELDVVYGIKQQYGFAGFAPDDTRISDTRLNGAYKLKAYVLHSLNQNVFISGAAIVTDEELIPPSDLFKLGGVRTLRGYREDQFFCDRYAAFTLQPELSLAGNARCHLFSDGAWFRQVSTETLFRWGAGGGFEFVLPTGKLLIDMAWGKNDCFSDGKLYVILESRF